MKLGTITKGDQVETALRLVANSVAWLRKEADLNMEKDIHGTEFGSVENCTIVDVEFAAKTLRRHAPLLLAAPSLLIALEEIVAEWDNNIPADPNHGKPGYGPRGDTPGIELARAAIAKATGEEPTS